MAERNAAAGRTPGPGGRGRSPAAASSVKVDTTDVEKLRRTLGDSAKAARELHDEIVKLNTGPTGALKSLNAEVQALRSGLATRGIRASSPATRTGGVGAANQGAGSVPAASTLGTDNNGGSYLPTAGGAAAVAARGHWTAGLSRPFAAAALGVTETVSSVAGLMSSHMDAAVDRSYLLNRYSLLGGRGMSYGSQMNLNRNLGTMFGNNTLGYADTTQAAGSLLASGAVTGTLGQSRVGSAAFGAALNPMNGAQGGAAMTARVFTPQNYYRARMMGINTLAGGKMDLQSFMDQFIDRYEGMARHKLTSPEIQSGNQPGMPLYLTLMSMGFADDSDRQNLLTYWSARNRTGKTGTAALKAARANTGLFKQAQQTANARGTALAQADVGGMKGMERGLQGKQAMYSALGDLADTPFGRVVTDATGTMSVFNQELKTATKLLEILIGGSVLKKLIAMAGGGKVVSTASTVASEARAAGTASTAARLSPVARKAGWVGAGLTVADMGQHTWNLAKTHEGDPWYMGPVNVLGDTGKTLGYGVKSTVVGAKNLVNDTLSFINPWGDKNPFSGDSDRDTPPLGDSGATWRAIESLARKGPPEIATSTTGGQHARNSYHYKGQAVDFAAPGGGNDTRALLAINRYFASRYGSKLKELIYAGPGGINIKDGKVVNGNAFYGAATMAQHHNHVHVAATPASLAGAGGGVGGARGNNGTGGSSDAPSAASSGGFAGSLLGSVFSSSSGASLLSALSSMGGGSIAGMVDGTSGGSTRGGGGGAAYGGDGSYHYGGRGALNYKQLEAIALRAGFPRNIVPTMAAIALAESHGNPNSHNPVPPDNSYGLWQINMLGAMGPGRRRQFDISTNDELYNPLTNAHAAHAIWKGQGLNAWSTYKSGAYRQYLKSYDTGKWELIQDEIAKLHRGEMVLPARTAEKVREAIDGRTPTGGGRSSGGHRIPVQLVFMVQNGSDREMREAARKFARYCDEEHDIELAASR